MTDHRANHPGEDAAVIGLDCSGSFWCLAGLWASCFRSPLLPPAPRKPAPRPFCPGGPALALVCSLTGGKGIL